MKKKRLCMIIVIVMAMLTGGCSNIRSGQKDGGDHNREISNESDISTEPGVTEDKAWSGSSESQTEEGDWAYNAKGTGRESYLEIDENEAVSSAEESMLTLSLKVDTASYSNVARYLSEGMRPPEDAVRTEELLNYFSYDGEMEFDGESPFSIYTEVGRSPFDDSRHIGFIRIKTPDVAKEELPPSNLVFLIDTSGSMGSEDKLPLLKEAFHLLTKQLDERDRISIVTYAGSSELVMSGTKGSKKRQIRAAVNHLEAGGSTAGGAGIQKAYETAQEHFIEGGNNRIILASDGDFNVGISDTEELKAFISEKKDSGVYLSVLGFGSGNLRDDMMETLAANGNGNYSYIPSSSVAEKVLVKELTTNMFVLAEDVKAQLEFNPDLVSEYRLIGYENRTMSNEEFRDDQADAGEIGYGTDVVIMFEMKLRNPETDAAYKYRQGEGQNKNGSNKYKDELYEVRIRYKNPGETSAREIKQTGTAEDIRKNNSQDFMFACSIAEFAEQLRESQHMAGWSVDQLYDLAKENLGKDTEQYRMDHLVLLRQYQSMGWLNGPGVIEE